jgi:hypothetical protein
LGDLEDVYPDHRILAFYCTGPKSYSLKLESREFKLDENGQMLKEVTYVTKAKGITLNLEASNHVEFNNIKVSHPGSFIAKNSIFKNMVNNFGHCEAQQVPARIWRPNRVQGNVTTKRTSKTFRGVCDKARLDSELDCFPFGFTGPFNTKI